MRIITPGKRLMHQLVSGNVRKGNGSEGIFAFTRFTINKPSLLMWFTPILLIYSCFVLSHPWADAIKFHSIMFPVKMEKITVAIDTFYQVNPSFKLPQSWQSFSDWKDRGFSYRESRMFFMNSNPQELYYIYFLGDVTCGYNSDNKVYFKLEAVCKGDGKWICEGNLDKREMRRIERRFDTEVISRIERLIDRQSSYENIYEQ